MKINVSYPENNQNDYINHSIIKEQGFELKNVDNGEAEEILALDVIEYIPRMMFDSIIQHWTSKLAHKGKLIVNFVDLYTVCRLFFIGQLEMQNVNFLLHGASLNGWDDKKVNMTVPQICKTLEGNGLKVISKKLDGMNALVIAERP